MKKVLIVGGLLVVAFLAGYGPLYFKNSDLQVKATALESDLKYAGVRLEAGMVLVEVQKGDFGKARERSTRFFDGVREIMESSTEEATKTALQGITKQRDQVTASLTALDPGVAVTFRTIYESMGSITSR